MWKKKLCLGVNPDFGVSYEEQIRMFASVGFEAFFTDWERGFELEKYRLLGDELGLIYQSVHAPFGRVADIWNNPTEGGEDALSELIESLEATASVGVEIMVCHAYIGFQKEYNPTFLGLSRFERLGVKLAFENTEGEEHLEAIMSHFKDSPFVGFCWDSGHEVCYNHSKDLLSKYGERLFCTHINDNLGIRSYDGEITYLDDLHLLPFDGIIDWDYNAKRLADSSFDSILTFEFNRSSKPCRHENDKYSLQSLESYLAECYSSACRVAAKLK